jgi:hypothetical protein
MEAMHIAEKDWASIMKPMVRVVLHCSKLSHTFPHDVFYLSGNSQGLGVMQPWHRKGICHLITLCKATMHGLPMGKLLQVNSEQLHLEMGMPGSFSNGPFQLIAEYMTDLWLRDLLLYLHKYKVKLKDSLPKLKKQ